MNKPVEDFLGFGKGVDEYIGCFYDFLDESGITIGGEGREKLNKVFSRIYKNFNGKTRQSGEPYITHLIEVTKIFIDLVGISNISFDDIVIALLHDSIEDIDHENFHDIQRDFGDYIAVGVLALSKPESSNKKMRNKHYYSRFQNIQSLTDFITNKSVKESISNKDIIYEKLAQVVVKIKLCDRIHNLRTMKLKEHENDEKGFTPEQKQAKLVESKKKFSNILNELGNDSISSEFNKAILFGTQSLIGYIQRKAMSSFSS